ncbi:hypothetical protein JCM11251_003178, partial [Rhodosporidiobolus azoricus]
PAARPLLRRRPRAARGGARRPSPPRGAEGEREERGVGRRGDRREKKEEEEGVRVPLEAGDWAVAAGLAVSLGVVGVLVKLGEASEGVRKTREPIPASPSQRRRHSVIVASRCACFTAETLLGPLHPPSTSPPSSCAQSRTAPPPLPLNSDLDAVSGDALKSAAALPARTVPSSLSSEGSE